MMKIFKLLSVLMFVALSAGFASCSDDDDDTIVGTWELVKNEYNYSSNGTLVDEVEEGTGKEVMMINADGKGVDEEGNTFSWKQDGKKITTIYVDEDGEEIVLNAEIQKLTNEELVTYYTVKDGGNVFYNRSTYKKVK